MHLAFFFYIDDAVAWSKQGKRKHFVVVSEYLKKWWSKCLNAHRQSICKVNIQYMFHIIKQKQEITLN